MSYIDSLNRFAQSPVGLDIGRSRFNMPYKHKTTFNSGMLIPLMWKEVLPGDTFKCDLSAVIRSITPVAPVMDDSFFDIYYFFVPNRLACRHSNDWAAVCGENFSGPWAQSSEATLENTGNFVLPSALWLNSNDPQNLTNYLGIPIISVSDLSGGGKFNTLPLVAYHRIWSEWFRDENVENPVDIEYLFTSGTLNTLRPVSKLHDYFTSCLPAPQKAASVALPLGTFAPVITQNTEHTASGQVGLHLRKTSDNSNTTGKIGVNSGILATGSDSANPGAAYLYPTNLYADLANATAASINAIRLAFALQRFAEKEGLSAAQGIGKY